MKHSNHVNIQLLYVSGYTEMQFGWSPSYLHKLEDTHSKSRNLIHHIIIYCDRHTVDHNIFAARKFRESAPMYIFATQNFRERAGTSTKKKNQQKNTNNAQRSSRYNNARSAMEALSVKLPGHHTGLSR